MKKYSAQHILLLTNNYYNLAMQKKASPLLFLALPFVSALVRDHLIDTARGIKDAVANLESKFPVLDEEANKVSMEDANSGQKLYKSYMGDFKKYRQDCAKLVKNYEILVNEKADPVERQKALSEIDQNMYSVSQQGATTRVRLDEAKHSLIKIIEVAEDFGMSLGLHNSVRQVQDAIDRLNIEIAKAIPEINKFKEQLSKAAESASTTQSKEKETLQTSNIGELSW